MKKLQEVFHSAKKRERGGERGLLPFGQPWGSLGRGECERKEGESTSLYRHMERDIVVRLVVPCGN